MVHEQTCVKQMISKAFCLGTDFLMYIFGLSSSGTFPSEIATLRFGCIACFNAVNLETIFYTSNYGKNFKVMVCVRVSFTPNVNCAWVKDGAPKVPMALFEKANPSVGMVRILVFKVASLFSS